MKRTTIFIDEHLESDLKALARRERRPVAALVREAVAGYVTGKKRKSRSAPSFLAIGRSGHRDTAERHEELLWQRLEPHGNTDQPRRTRAKARSGTRVRIRGARSRPGRR